VNDYNNYQTARKLTTSQDFLTGHNKELEEPSKKGGLSSRRNMHKSFMQENMYQIESQEIDKDLKKITKRLHDGNERRDRSLRSRVQPIKEHLNRIHSVLRNVHKDKERLMHDSVLSYSEKDKRITETRKRKQKYSLYSAKPQEHDFAQGTE